MLKIIGGKPQELILESTRQNGEEPAKIWLRPIPIEKFGSVYPLLGGPELQKLADLDMEEKDPVALISAIPWEILSAIRPLLAASITSWENICDEDEEVLEFNQKNLQLFSQYAPVPVMMEIFISLINLTLEGSIRGAEKNVESSPS